MLNYKDKIKKNNNLVKTNLFKRIDNFLSVKINPNLLIHGGSVKLIDVTCDNKVILKFIGGCNGCYMARFTLKENIEKRLLKHFPELLEICDVTDHVHGDHSYF